ncbi:MAG: DUF4249 domain-containing protein [Bacteroidota bacterium]
MNAIKIFLFIIVTALCSCREEFKPPAVSSPNTYLVVEGVLNIGPGSTTIRLTKTFRLNDSARLRPETNARLQVEKDDNTVYLLAETGNGYYSGTNLNLQVNGKYRLRIKTAAGKEYLSDYSTGRSTPPIDSIGWRYTTEGVRIYANTHDPANSTRYYRWDYDETWEIRSNYVNYLKVVNGAYVPRIFPQDDVSVCWKYAASTNILISSSAQLQSDVISEAPLAFIPRGTERLGVRYSMLVRQYAIDKEAYTFLEQMKRNTESIGTVFDPQPSEIYGNIRCVSTPDEPVIGYVTASAVQTKRIFITVAEVNTPFWNFFLRCETMDVMAVPDSIRKYIPPWIPFDIVPSVPAVYNCSTPVCIDCTQRGGSLVKPSYW